MSQTKMCLFTCFWTKLRTSQVQTSHLDKWNTLYLAHSFHFICQKNILQVILYNTTCTHCTACTLQTIMLSYLLTFTRLRLRMAKLRCLEVNMTARDGSRVANALKQTFFIVKSVQKHSHNILRRM